jgi:hypothetical protein
MAAVPEDIHLMELIASQSEEIAELALFLKRLLCH